MNVKERHSSPLTASGGRRYKPDASRRPLLKAAASRRERLADVLAGRANGIATDDVRLVRPGLAAAGYQRQAR